LGLGRGPKNVIAAGAPPPPLGMGTWLTPRKMPFLRLYYCAKFGYSRSNQSSIIMVRAIKFLPLMPFKVTRGHWNWYGSIGYLWLPISVP